MVSVPTKWLFAKKNIYERTHLWQKPNSAQLLVNENVIKQLPLKSVGFFTERTHFFTNEPIFKNHKRNPLPEDFAPDGA